MSLEVPKRPQTGSLETAKRPSTFAGTGKAPMSAPLGRAPPAPPAPPSFGSLTPSPRPPPPPPPPPPSTYSLSPQPKPYSQSQQQQPDINSSPQNSGLAALPSFAVPARLGATNSPAPPAGWTPPANSQSPSPAAANYS